MLFASTYLFNSPTPPPNLGEAAEEYVPFVSEKQFEVRLIFGEYRHVV